MRSIPAALCKRCRLSGWLALAMLMAPLAVSAEPAPRLPAEAFFADPEFHGPKLSPDGEHIAVLHSDGEAQMVVVREAKGGSLMPITRLTDPETRMLWLDWANPERVLGSSLVREEDADDAPAGDRPL